MLVGCGSKKYIIMSGNDGIKIGEYIIIQRQNYNKLHKFNKANSAVSLGRDTIDLSGVEGCKYFSVFKMLSKGNRKNRIYSLKLCDEAVGLKEEIDVKSSGTDNRNIQDDGNSQKLSAAEIEGLKSDATKGSDIVETLISNSNTFSSKTEFSQDKYLKKKEKKYFDYIQIVRPNLRVIADIMYKLDPSKIQGLRLDTLSQIITMSNVCAQGCHLLYDSGSNGLMAAALLGAIGEEGEGKLLHMHPGNMSQKQALLAMNFSEKQLQCCTSVNIYSALRQLYQGCDTHEEKDKDVDTENTKKRKLEDNHVHQSKVPKLEVSAEVETNEVTSDDKISNNGQGEQKKPKWHYDNITAAELLEQKVDSLVIVCKEDPQNIFKELVTFVKPGRPFVVYFNVVEPLQSLYLMLKSDSRIAALRLTSNWMRNYQVLPERTHPEVNMNGSSGFLLTGYVLK